MTDESQTYEPQPCRNCGLPLDNDGLFCSKCGTSRMPSSNAEQTKSPNLLRGMFGLALIGAVGYVTVFSIPVISLISPGPELSIEIKRGARQTTGNFGTVHITNLSPSPVKFTEVRVNRRQDDACSWKGTHKLPTGEEMVVSLIPAMMGLCGGTMSIISVVTDKGEADYTMRW